MDVPSPERRKTNTKRQKNELNGRTTAVFDNVAGKQTRKPSWADKQPSGPISYLTCKPAVGGYVDVSHPKSPAPSARGSAIRTRRIGDGSQACRMHFNKSHASLRWPAFLGFPSQLRHLAIRLPRLPPAWDGSRREDDSVDRLPSIRSPA